MTDSPTTTKTLLGHELAEAFGSPRLGAQPARQGPFRGDEVPAPPGHERRIPLRRREPRVRPVEDRLWIEWWSDEEMLGRSARLVNVSRHGAMIVTSAGLRRLDSLRLYLEEPAPQIGVRANVLQVVEGLHGIHQVRLEFIAPCPDAFFEAATNGIDAWLNHTIAAC